MGINYLTKVIGATISKIDESDGQLGIHFQDGSSIGIYNLHEFVPSKSPLEMKTLVGTSVKNIIEEEQKLILFILSDLTELRVRLDDGGYVGPEAYSLKLADGTNVVERGPE
jgi:hypothetical protein